LPAERIREPARTNSSPTAADAIEDEVQEALAICGGDAIAALRITSIANAFLEAEIDRRSAVVSSGFAYSRCCSAGCFWRSSSPLTAPESCSSWAIMRR
jgi:hypothetical protein